MTLISLFLSSSFYDIYRNFLINFIHRDERNSTVYPLYKTALLYVYLYVIIIVIYHVHWDPNFEINLILFYFIQFYFTMISDLCKDAFSFILQYNCTTKGSIHTITLMIFNSISKRMKLMKKRKIFIPLSLPKKPKWYGFVIYYFSNTGYNCVDLHSWLQHLTKAVPYICRLPYKSSVPDFKTLCNPGPGADWFCPDDASWREPRIKAL